MSVSRSIVSIGPGRYRTSAQLTNSRPTPRSLSWNRNMKVPRGVASGGPTDAIFSFITGWTARGEPRERHEP